MKKALVVLAAAALLLWIVSWFRTPEIVATSAAQSWPGDLGRLDAVANRYPPRQANEATKKLAALAGALPKGDAVETFVGSEIERGALTIGEPPALPDVSAMRDLLLRETLVWGRPGGVGEIGDQETSNARGVQMNVARALVASALGKARTSDPAAWDELRAVWNLARSLERQPQVMTQTAALSMLRMINAVAWKLPLPAPDWFGELQARDAVPRLLEAFQYQAASYWESGTQMFPTKSLADGVEHDRGIAEALSREMRCNVDTPMNELGVDLSSVWHRAFRYRAEREATANALRLREGKPIVPASRCTGGSWASDGATLRFSGEIAPSPKDRAMPLVLRVKAAS